MDVNIEIIQLRQMIEEQRKVLEQKIHTIENLNRELVRYQTECELTEKTIEEVTQELVHMTKIVEDTQVMIELKDRYIESLEKEKKRLIMSNIGLFTIVIILIAIIIFFSLKS